MPKGTNAEVAQRVQAVREWLLEGNTRSDILRYTTSWKITDRTVDEYMARATDEIKEINDIDFKTNRSLVLKNLWETYGRAKEAKNLKEQKGILDSIARICGLEKLVIEVKDEFPDLDQVEVLNELEERLSAVH